MVQVAKPSGELFDDTPRGLLEALLFAGGITIALTTAPPLIAALGGLGYILKAGEAKRRKKFNRYSHYLHRRKYITTRKVSRSRVRISLTPLGRRRALDARARRMLAIPVKRPRSWDRKYRLILFDIATEERVKRNAFRAFIRKIGAVMLQKSVWVHPFDCSEHISLLRDFFGFSDRELRLVLADTIGEDRDIRKHFRI